MKLYRTLLIAFCALAAIPAAAGEYTIGPMRLEFDRDAKSGVVTLTNASQDRLDFQIRAMEWTQDGDGNDRYVETGDVIFFPRIFAVEPNAQRVVRVGVKSKYW